MGILRRDGARRRARLGGARPAGGANLPIAIGLVLMMYPPLAEVRYAALPRVFADRRVLALSLLQNWILGPMLMFALAAVFPHDRPDPMTGLILIGLARCIAMVLVRNALARGDAQYVAGLVAFDGLFQLLFFGAFVRFFLAVLPPWLGLEGRIVQVSFVTISRAVLLYLGLPFAAGWLTRRVLAGRHGEAWHRDRFLPRIAPVALAALLFTIVAMFVPKSGDVVRLPLDALRIAVPLAIDFPVMFLVPAGCVG